MKQMLKQLNANMVRIDGGCVKLRDDRKKTEWQVELAPYQLCSVPVTQELYSEMIGSNPSSVAGGMHPVVNVSWYDAIAFCNSLSDQLGVEQVYLIGEDQDDVTFVQDANGYRLPTDAEWQHAALGGESSPRYGNVDAVSWYRENSASQTHAVGMKQPNAFGLFDMLGNVWEWCFDVYDAEVYGAYRVFRGGGWNDPERGCLATNRRRSHPTYGIDDVGFRIARNG